MDNAFLSPRARKNVQNYTGQPMYELKDQAQARMIEREKKMSEQVSLGEAPASVTIKTVSSGGYDILLTLRDADAAALMSRMKAALGWLAQNNFQPTRNGYAPSTNGNGTAPACEFHGPMKRSTKFNGWFCPSKMGDGSYCKSQSKD